MGGVPTAILIVSDKYILLMIFATFFGANTAASDGAVVVGILETYYGYEHLELAFGVNLAVIGIGNLLGSSIACKNQILIRYNYTFMIEISN